MKYLKIYENFVSEQMPMETLPMETDMSNVHFEVESDEIMPTDGNTEGNYYVNFKNSEGQDTTIEICGAADPEFVGDTMVSDIEMVQDSSSDGKPYSVTGYYKEVPGTQGAYELEKVLIEEI